METLDAMSHLAYTYEEQGRYGEAERFRLQVLELSEPLGSNYPKVLGAVVGLAPTYVTQSKLERAEQLQQRVLSARQQLLGASHLETLNAMAWLS